MAVLVPARWNGSDIVTPMITATRPPRPAHRVSVTAVEPLGPHLRRITFGSGSLADLPARHPAQWLKIVLPGSASDRQSRAYTIRRFSVDRATLEVDFVLHGDSGPASIWASRARIGDVVELGSPRGGFHAWSGARWRLLVGDETALPAIASILEAARKEDLPTQAIIEVPCMDDAQLLQAGARVDIRWLPRDLYGAAPGAAMAACVSCLDFAPEPGEVFCAGEAVAVRSVRAELSRRAPQARVDAKGYWRMGHADHRDVS